MKVLSHTCLLLTLSILIHGQIAHAQEWQSGEKQAQLVELFTSEGCSSCPPADEWLSTLKDDPRLFNGLVPIAFHVDYWDYIGWKDPFASPLHTQRQRAYARSGHISQVYTPGFVVNNKEWRQWFYHQRDLPNATKPADELNASLNDDNILSVNFSGEQSNILHVAYLGMGLTTQVKAGENRNRKLEHDFVALKYFTLPGTQQWSVLLPERPDLGQDKTALAIWVSDRKSKVVLQAVGGYLN
ncbi:DUF1223 domain-containing protein [Marinomonas sp.]|nr:DUF1223 domain-containing protein [Marinomonas sp.]MDB4838014.1 DUF1223 domain-containing protein [Marinomonas sp.]